MQTAGYIASLFVGISLGLIGGGGSILTVPLLVFLFGINPILSTSYSLFIVGTTSLVGAIDNYRKNLVRVKVAILFGMSSITTVFITRKFLIPLIPNKLFTINGFTVTQSWATMILFAAVMIMAANAMIRNETNTIKVNTKKDSNLIILLSYGVAVGLATGILGAGGGFLLIPTLVLIVGLPMKEAVGTSLLIIALNSLIGFTGDLGHFVIDWKFLGVLTGIAVAGIIVGGLLNKKIHGEKLKKGFGWFVLIMGVFILVHEIFFYNWK
ncbi:MAG: sulfite exporter TauE/SafE family protein [Ferruginibacter sp.]